MNKVTAIVSCVLASLLFFSTPIVNGQESQGAKIISEMSFPELKFIKPKPNKTILDNGLILYSLRGRSGSLVYLKAIIRAGAVYDSEDLAGLSGFAGYVINSGGAMKNASEFFKELESLGVSFSADIGMESGEINLSCLREDAPKALDILRGILISPEYSQKTLDLCKAQVLEAFRVAGDSPRGMIRQHLPGLIYGSFPYNNSGAVIGSGYRGGTVISGVTPESVEKVTVADLRRFHKKYFSPQNIILGISGGFELADKKMIADTFRKWINKRNANLQIPPVKVEISANPGVYFLPKEQLTQSTLALGHIGVKKSGSDYFALQVLGEIFGESFTSRLNREVRVKRGLAYSIGGYFSWRHSYPGLFLVYTKTKSESTAEVINVIVNEITKIVNNGVTDKELREVKEVVENQFVFKFSGGSILEQIMYLNYFGESEDYLETYLDNVRKVTREDVLRVARKYLHPDKLTIVIVGNPDILPDLEKEYGSIKVNIIP